MPVQILGTGVLIRLATDDEARAVEHGRLGLNFEGSDISVRPGRRLAEDEIYVVSRAFVDFGEDGAEQRWTSKDHHGYPVSTVADVTMDLVRLADATAEEGFLDLLSDMGIARLGVSRWALMSAPRRIELTPELEARLAPLRHR